MHNHAHSRTLQSLSHSLTHSFIHAHLLTLPLTPVESRKHRTWKEEGAMERDFDAFSTTQNTSTLQASPLTRYHHRYHHHYLPFTRISRIEQL